MEGKQINYLIS